MAPPWAGAARRAAPALPRLALPPDGDGGDENLKDYPIEEDPELTIRSVVNNRLLYQEGWGVQALKHSLTYSGGHSRGCVRGWAPARRHGFLPFSPFTRPSVVAVAEAIPFAALAAGSHERLYALKGEVLARGLRRHLGVDMPAFPKRRFQHGAGGRRWRAAGAPRGAVPRALRGGGGGASRSPRPAPRACDDGGAPHGPARRRGDPATRLLHRQFLAHSPVPPSSPMPPSSRAQRSDLDAATVKALRQQKPAIDPWRPLGTLWEHERQPGGAVAPVLTVFLAGAECPFSCVFCDLWRHTLEGPTPRGALPVQLRRALAEAGPIAPEAQVKLYNASNFFDARAVPPEDDEALAALLAPFAQVVVECHPRLVGDRAEQFAAMLGRAAAAAPGSAGTKPRLQVAIGLETVHPEALPRLGKAMSLDDFAAAAARLRAIGAGVRAFVLIGVPYVAAEEAAEWPSARPPGRSRTASSTCR